MSEDPFFVVRDEVEKAVQTARGLYQRWNDLRKDLNTVSKEEYDWTSNELRNSLRSIEWDLEDLDETIGIVEKNPRKFKITGNELGERKAFINNTKAAVKEMKNHLTNPNSMSSANSNAKQPLYPGANEPNKPVDRYTRHENLVEKANTKYIDDTMHQQQQVMHTQDETLEAVGGHVTVLRDMSHKIGNELDEQAVMLDGLGHDIDHTDSRMDSTMKKMAKVLHMTNDRRQWCAIGSLIVVLIIVIILFIVL